MPRFIIRYRGKGARPEDAVQKVQGIDGATILEDSGRMMLVEAPEGALRTVLTPEDWIVSAESGYTVPDTRKKIAGPSKRR